MEAPWVPDVWTQLLPVTFVTTARPGTVTVAAAALSVRLSLRNSIPDSKRAAVRSAQLVKGDCVRSLFTVSLFSPFLWFRVFDILGGWIYC